MPRPRPAMTSRWPGHSRPSPDRGRPAPVRGPRRGTWVVPAASIVAPRGSAGRESTTRRRRDRARTCWRGVPASVRSPFRRATPARIATSTAADPSGVTVNRTGGASDALGPSSFIKLGTGDGRADWPGRRCSSTADGSAITPNTSRKRNDSSNRSNRRVSPRPSPPSSSSRRRRRLRRLRRLRFLGRFFLVRTAVVSVALGGAATGRDGAAAAASSTASEMSTSSRAATRALTRDSSTSTPAASKHVGEVCFVDLFARFVQDECCVNVFHCCVVSVLEHRSECVASVLVVVIVVLGRLGLVGF